MANINKAQISSVSLLSLWGLRLKPPHENLSKNRSWATPEKPRPRQDVSSRDQDEVETFGLRTETWIFVKIENTINNGQGYQEQWFSINNGQGYQEQWYSIVLCLFMEDFILLNCQWGSLLSINSLVMKPIIVECTVGSVFPWILYLLEKSYTTLNFSLQGGSLVTTSVRCFESGLDIGRSSSLGLIAQQQTITTNQ